MWTLFIATRQPVSSQDLQPLIAARGGIWTEHGEGVIEREGMLVIVDFGGGLEALGPEDFEELQARLGGAVAGTVAVHSSGTGASLARELADEIAKRFGGVVEES